MHDNSLAAYKEEVGAFGERAQQVVGTIARLGVATDKQVAQAMGFAHKSAVQPRISELVKAGVLTECGRVRDPETRKTVRQVCLRE